MAEKDMRMHVVHAWCIGTVATVVQAFIPTSEDNCTLLRRSHASWSEPLQG